MKLQLAIDLLDLQAVRALLEEVVDLIDIIEIGTPLLYQEGMSIVREIKSRYPTVALLADLKIVDAGDLEAQIAFEAGADIVTVLGVAHDVTIEGALLQARQQRGKEIMVDLVTVIDLPRRARDLDQMGIDTLCVHTAYDMQSHAQSPLAALQAVKRVCANAKIAIAGGIKPATLRDIVHFAPDIVVVGGFITGQADKRKAALEIRQLFSQPSDL